ncbi:4079_t:CDS:2 [Acaulospora morrowiae]|uniref:4079_t:CDS:1 n=1 Tax=Acaulospora morrowiae TaxID=94023 RepID=A0A9N9DAB8_9GLOM|nr:4079_t:CDS:2 [Acaulospora morrowiae]
MLVRDFWLLLDLFDTQNIDDCNVYLLGRLSRSVSERDIDEAFGKYGRIREVDMKIGFCFVQFDDPRDADDAMRALDGVRIPGNDERILVEFARGSTWRGARDSGSRGSGGRFDGRSPERCFNCGQIGPEIAARKWRTLSKVVIFFYQCQVHYAFCIFDTEVIDDYQIRRKPLLYLRTAGASC